MLNTISIWNSVLYKTLDKDPFFFFCLFFVLNKHPIHHLVIRPSFTTDNAILSCIRLLHMGGYGSDLSVYPKLIKYCLNFLCIDSKILYLGQRESSGSS